MATTLDQDKLDQQRRMVRRFALFLLRDPDAADDITQETFRIAVSKGWPAGGGPDQGAWLRAIVRNLVRNHFRKRSTDTLLLHGDAMELAESRFVATRSDEEETWESRREALAACLGKLPQAQRHLLRRRYEHGEMIRELARQFGAAPNTLSQRLARIRRQLRKCIDASLRGRPA